MHCPSSLEIQSYVDEELASPAAAYVRKHLERCRTCRELARDLAATGALLSSLAEVPAPPPGLAAAAMRSAQARRGWKRWILLPAAATLILAAIAVRRHWQPAGMDEDFVQVFVEAHYTSALAEYSPGPCDFGLGGGWR